MLWNGPTPKQKPTFGPDIKERRVKPDELSAPITQQTAPNVPIKAEDWLEALLQCPIGTVEQPVSVPMGQRYEHDPAECQVYRCKVCKAHYAR